MWLGYEGRLGLRDSVIIELLTLLLFPTLHYYYILSVQLNLNLNSMKNLKSLQQQRPGIQAPPAQHLPNLSGKQQQQQPQASHHQQMLLQQQQMRLQQQQYAMQQQQQQLEQEEDLMDDEEIAYMIHELGNDILRMLGVPQPVEDIGVFFTDAFFLQYFDAAFPELDFSELQPGQTDQEVGDNIQDLIDVLAQEIMRQDLSHISGHEIAMGDPDHCLELLQIIHQLTVMMAEEEGDSKANPATSQESPDSNTFSQQNKFHQSNEKQDEYDEEEEPSPATQQQQQAQEEMIDDDYDDEDDDSNQRLSPLHNKAQAACKEAEELDQDYGIENNNNQEEEDADYYDELVKRGRKLHSKVEVEGGDDFDQEFSKEDKGGEEAYEDEFEEEDESEQKTPSPVQAKPVIEVNKGKQSPEVVKEMPKPSPPMGQKKAVNISQSQSEDFKDYDEEDEDDEIEEEEEILAPVMPKKVEFPFAKAAPAPPVEDKPQQSLYDFSKKEGEAVQIIGQKPATSFKPSWMQKQAAQPTQQQPSQPVNAFNTQQTPIFFGAQQPGKELLVPEKEESFIEESYQSSSHNKSPSPQQSSTSKQSLKQQSTSELANTSLNKQRLSSSRQSAREQQQMVPELKNPEKVEANQDLSPPNKQDDSVKKVQKQVSESVKQVEKTIQQVQQKKLDDSLRQQQELAQVQKEPIVVQKPQPQPAQSLFNDDILGKIDQLDQESKLALLKQLLAEYDSSPPNTFPFPREVVSEFILKENPNNISNSMTFNNIQLGKGFLDQDFKEPSSFSENRKKRPNTAKQPKSLQKIQNGVPVQKIQNGVPLRISEEQLNQMSSRELKELIKSQQMLLVEQEQKLMTRARSQSKKKQQKKKMGSSKGKTIERPQAQELSYSQKTVPTPAPSQKNRKSKMIPIHTQPPKPNHVSNVKSARSSQSRSKSHRRQLKSTDRQTEATSPIRRPSTTRKDFGQTPNRSERVISPATMSQPSIIASIKKDKEFRIQQFNPSATSQDAEGIDLTDNQLVQMVKVAESLPRDQQKMLVQVLSDKASKGSVTRSPNTSNYKNLYQKLMDTFKKANISVNQNKQKKSLPKTVRDSQLVLKQQQNNFELLVKNYNNEVKTLEAKQVKEDVMREQRLVRDEKIEALREKRALDQILRKQIQSDALRKEQHDKVQRQFLKMAREIEKKRLQDDREVRREAAMEAIHKSEKIVGKIEQVFNTRVNQLKEKIDEEKYERIVSQQAQVQVISSLSKELKQEKRKEIERYNQLKAKHQAPRGRKQ